jgi:thioredoxin reductase (NADPH)
MSVQMKEYECEICIIGAGPAGLSAGVYCGRAGRNTIILKGKEKGALERTKAIENWLGEPKIQGDSLLQKFKDHVKSIENVRIIEGDVISLMLGMGKNMISTRNANLTADAVIIATGMGNREEIIEGESKLVGYGVSYCALCDGPLYVDKKVFLYGEDEELIEDALILDQMGCHVNIITPKSLNELPNEIKQAQEKGIDVIPNAEILEVEANSNGLLDKIDYKLENDQVKEAELDGLFIFSHVPSNSIFKKAGVELDENGNISVNAHQETNLKGVFAAGDVTGGLYQVIFAVAEGGRARINAAKYVRHLQKE